MVDMTVGKIDVAHECIQISNRYLASAQDGQDLCDEIWSLVHRAEQAAAARARAEEREALLLAWAAGHDSLTRHIARISDGNPHAAVAAIRARSDSD